MNAPRRPEERFAYASPASQAPANAIQFGLAPFFQTEPLAGVRGFGADRRRPPSAHRRPAFRTPAARRILRDYTPRVVGIACLHILDVPATLQLPAPSRSTTLP